MDLKRLEKILEPVFEEHDIRKTSIRLLSGKTDTLEIMIMKSDGSMDMNTCESVSRKVSVILDEIDFGQQAYNLDVCSFGAERSLGSLEEIEAEINSYVHVELKNPKEGLDIFEGELTELQDRRLTIEHSVKGRKKTAVVDYDNIRLIRMAVKL